MNPGRLEAALDTEPYLGTDESMSIPESGYRQTAGRSIPARGDYSQASALEDMSAVLAFPKVAWSSLPSPL